jgi:hypothetical protein
MRSTRLAAFAAAASVALSACSERSRPAHGEATSLIIVAVDSLWSAVESEVTTALAPRIFAVTDEAAFVLTQISPADPTWRELRNFRQVLPIGLATDAWVAPVLEEYPAGEPPAIVEAQNIWASGQGVTAVVLPETDPQGALRSVLPQLGSLLDRRFREYALSRMFASRADTALRDTLERTAGFSLLLPNVYRRTVVGDTHVFRHHAEMGGELMRTITIAARPGVTATPTRQMALAWRDSLSGTAFDLIQTVDTAQIQERTIEGDTAGFEVQGVWRSADPAWPAAGPFIDRIVPCPAQDKTYFIDAWLFAPGKKKYEYMIQLQTILNSFRCGNAAAAAGA